MANIISLLNIMENTKIEQINKEISILKQQYYDINKVVKKGKKQLSVLNKEIDSLEKFLHIHQKQ